VITLLRHGVLVAAVLGVLGSGPARAQGPVVAYDGIEIFCHLLHYLKFEPLPFDELAQANAEETLIVAFGNLASLEGVHKTVGDSRGHAWLIASDRPTGRLEPDRRDRETSVLRESRLEKWKLRIASAVVEQKAELAYQTLPRCPLIKEGVDAGHPAFRGIRKGIATNRPSYLDSRESDLFLLAAFDPGSRADDGADLLRETIGYAFGTRGDSPERVLILAGEGVFINGMMAQFDNDNLLFSLNALRWLKADGRRRALVLYNGEAVTRFDLPLTPPFNIPIPPVHVLNQMLRELENEGILRRLLHEEVGPENLLRIALGIVSVGLVLYGAKRLFATRHQQEAVPLIVGRSAGPAPVRPLAQQRQQELLLRDNLWEPAQALARQWFVEHARIEPPLWDEADGAASPRCLARGGWLARRKLTRQVRQLWSYATRDPARPVTLAEFRRVGLLHDALTQAAREGRLTFETIG
jgi:hypothetical protein